LLKERDILLGLDHAAAWELVSEIRARLKLGFIKAFQYVRENEVAAYGDRSFYRLTRGEIRPAADNCVSDSDISELSVIDKDAVKTRRTVICQGKGRNEGKALSSSDTDMSSQLVTDDGDSEEDEDNDEVNW
jgi:hypothetical protein